MKLCLFTLFLASVSMMAVDVENTLCEDFSLGGYLDARYIQYGIYNAVPSREFSIRRAGIEAAASLSSNLNAELKLEFRPDEVFLKDAVVEWRPIDSSRGRFGLFRGETLLGGDLSSWDLPLMERPLIYDLREELTYSGRDLGFDARFSFPVFDSIELEGTAGLFNGDERGSEREDNELLYSFRGTAEFKPADLTLGFSAVSHRKGIMDQSTPDGYTSSQRLFAFSGDVSFSRSFSNWYDTVVYGEFSTGDNWSLCDVLAGEDPPQFAGFWGAVTINYHPWNVQAIRTLSLSIGIDQVKQDTELDFHERRISVIGAVYPAENIRIRFGGVRTSEEDLLLSSEYTDIIAEVGLRF